MLSCNKYNSNLSNRFRRGRGSNCSPSAAKKKRERNWNMEKVYKRKKDAIDFVNSENKWSLHYKNETTEGNKEYYRCNQAKLKGDQCPASIYLLFDSTN